MARNTVIVSVLGDTRDLQKKLGDSGDALGNWAKAGVAAAAILGAALIGGAAKGVKAASELEQNLGALQSVFKENAGQMEEWATAAASSVGLAKSEYAGLATILGSQLRNMGVDAAQLGQQTDDLIRVGADLSAQFGGSTKDAVAALSSLLRGEREPIKRFGVSLGEVDIQAKLLEMGLAGLTGEAGKNAKLQATLALLYEQTADAAGAFTRESTTLAGAQQRLAAGTENLFATFGTALLPAMVAVTAAAGTLINLIQGSAWFAAMNESLVAATNGFADFVFSIINGTSSLNFSDVFAGLLSGVIAGVADAAAWVNRDGLTTLLSSITEGRGVLFAGAMQLFNTLAEALPQILPAVIAALTGFLAAMLAQVATFVLPLLVIGLTLFRGLVESIAIIAPQLIAQLAAMLPDLLTTILKFVPLLLNAAISVFTMLVDAIPIILPPLIATIVGLLPVLVNSVLSMLPDILAAAINLFTALVASIPVILPLLLRAIIDLLPSLIGSVLSMLPALLRGAVQLFTGLVSAIPQIIPPLLGALIALAPVIIGAIIGLIPVLLRAGVDLIGGLVSGLFKAAGSVGKALLDIAKGAVGGFLKFLGIKSPSRLFASFGKDTVAGLAVGLRKNAGLVDGAMDQLSDRVAGGFSAQLSAPEIDGAFNTYSTGRSSSSMSATPATIQINLQTLNPTAETGRIIVESIRDYEFSGGRL
jgi:hypothetical protein